MRLLPIECVRENSYLAQTIYDNDGKVLLRAGAILTDNIIKKIKELNIFSLYVVDEYSEREIEDIIKPELRQKSITLVKETFNHIEKINNFSSTHKNLPSEMLIKDTEYFRSIYDIAQELIDNITSNTNILVSLVDIKSMDNYTYQHSVNVSILSLIMGLSLKLPKNKLLELCIGALLHDIGKVFVPKEIIKKAGPLTFDEFEAIKLHPSKGYDYLRKKFHVKTSSILIASQHHERIDGLGYPKGLKGDEISLFAKIVSIADVYDALTSDRAYRRAMCASDALEYIMANGDTMFDFELVKLFSKIIVPFPFGTIVRLSNGDVGVVQETLPNFPLRPNIKIMKSSDETKHGKMLNLVNELSIVISGIQYDL